MIYPSLVLVLLLLLLLQCVVKNILYLYIGPFSSICIWMEHMCMQ